MTSAKKTRSLGERHAWIFRDPAVRGYFGYMASDIGQCMARLRAELDAGRLADAIMTARCMDMFLSQHSLSKGRKSDWIVPSAPPADPTPYRPRTPEGRILAAAFERITDESQRTDAIFRVRAAIKPFLQKDRALRRRGLKVIELFPRGKP